MRERPMQTMRSRTLSIDGGCSQHHSPFAPWPFFDEEMVEAVSSVLRSGNVNYWTGQEGRQFEKEFAAFVSVDNAVAVANGTLALELALHALGIGAGDDVVVTSRTFVASASCVVIRGARPVFADVDPVTQNVTAESIEAVLTPNTKAIIAVHLAGWSCDMDPIMALARDRGLKVIEDCAQAHGATYKGRVVGSIGHAGAFSFCQDKIMTTGGEGGMLVSNDRDVWRRAWSYKDHGKDWDTVYNKEHPPGFRWLHTSFGTNWRLTEMQSAIGRAMLRRLPDWISTRREYARVLDERFSRIPALRVSIPPDDIEHAYYKYYVFVRPERLTDGWNRDRIMEAVAAEGIPCYSGSCSEIYLESAFPSEWRPTRRLPVAKELGETSLMFLVHPTLSRQDIEDTCAAVEKVMSVASRHERLAA